MKAARLPANEAQRLVVLRSYDVLDTEPEAAFDDHTALAAYICQAPIALITLVDKDRVWFKSKFGLDTAEIPRKLSFCSYVVPHHDIFIVPDALKDKRFADNPVVTADPCIRFYAGMSLVTQEGYAIGALCVIDHVPRELNTEQQLALRVLSRHVMTLVELRHRTIDLTRARADRQRNAEMLALANTQLQTAEELKSSISLLTATLESTADGILVVGKNRKISRFNQRFIDMWRIPQKIIDSHDDDLALSFVLDQLREPDNFIAKVKGLYAHPKAESFDVLEFMDGRTFERYSRPQLVAGRAIGRVWSFRDVTERRWAEEALERSEERYRVLWETTTDVVLVLDEHSQIQYANPALMEVFGYDPSAVVGQNLSMLQPERLREAHSHGVARYLDTRVKKLDWRSAEVIGLHRDGHEFPIEISFTHVENNGKHLLAGFLRDITERKQTEASVVEWKNRYEAAINASGQLLYDWDPTTNVVSYGGDVERILGFRMEEMAGGLAHWLELIHPDDRAEFSREIARVIATQTPFHQEYRVRRKDGAYLFVQDHGYFVPDAAGNITKMVGFVIDITEHRRAEQRERSRNHVLELMALGSPLTEILHSIVRNMEQENPAMLCSILLMDSEGKHLLTGASPSLPDFYNVAIHGAEIGIGVGSCGTAAYTGERVIVEDIKTHPYWKSYKKVAAKASLRSCWSEPIWSAAGKVIGTFAIYHHEASTPTENDIQSIEQAANLAGIAIERSLSSEELQQALLVYKNNSEAMMVTDANDVIITVNPAFIRVTGYSLKEIIGKNVSILSSGRHDEAFYQAIRHEIDTTGQWQGEVWDRRKGGEAYAVWRTISSIFNDDGSVHRRISLFSDITERKKSEELIWQQANYDPLTGLPNRHMFHDRLEQDVKKAQRAGGLPLALMFIDLDRFKEVNDVFGHDLGDALLKEVAQRLSSCVRETDTVARLGGDEFTITLGDLGDFSIVERVAQDILHKLTESFQLGSELAYVSASIGITYYPEDATAVEALVKNADQAMYAAKNLGRNRYHYFTPSMQQAAQNRMLIANDLRGALAGNQFIVYYQPIVELATGAIRKAEALIRWQHPTRGLISPAEFISIAEDTGLIIDIGDWVFREAAHQVKHWRTAYHPEFQVSVNKSPVQFHNANEAYHVAWINLLQKLGLTGNSVVMEITEGLLLDASVLVANRLLKLRDAGIQVAIDDFGTGYSSLSYLKKFDIDYLKIDRSFVGNLTPGSDDLVLCEAIIVMAHKLGIQVIAEGVETEEQRALLAAAGCDYAQGYLFYRPVPAEEFERFLESRPTK